MNLAVVSKKRRWQFVVDVEVDEDRAGVGEAEMRAIIARELAARARNLNPTKTATAFFEAEVNEDGEPPFVTGD